MALDRTGIWAKRGRLILDEADVDQLPSTAVFGILKMNLPDVSVSLTYYYILDYNINP